MEGPTRHRQGRESNYTHFGSLPFIRQTHRQSIRATQDLIEQILGKSMENRKLRRASQLLMHLTLGMLSLADNQLQAKAVQIMQQLRGELERELKQTTLTFSKIGYFSRFSNRSQLHEVNVIYLQPEDDLQLAKVKRTTDRILRRMVEAQIVNEKDYGSMHISYNQKTDKFQINEYHLTLFRLEGGVIEDQQFVQAIEEMQQLVKPMRLECDSVDISTRFHYDESKFYAPLSRVRLQ